MSGFYARTKHFLKYLAKIFPLNASIFGCKGGFFCVLVKTFFGANGAGLFFMPFAHKTSGLRSITQKFHSDGYTKPRWKVLYPLERGGSKKL